MLDVSAFDELLGELGDEATALLVDLIATWETETERQLAELAGDPARTLHAMRGSSAALGAVRLARVCTQLEDRLRTGCLDLAAGSRALHAEADTARSALRGYVGSR